MSQTELVEKNVPGTARIMLVDDEPSIRDAMSELLESESLAVLTANGSIECLRLLEQGFRGVILMDVMMPGMDGWQTIREIEKQGLLEGNIILMLTALDVPGEHMEGLQEVVTDYIIKPFEPAGLITAVKKYLVILDQIRERD